jgi:PhzF family phenazine biosynthesis protein
VRRDSLGASGEDGAMTQVRFAFVDVFADRPLSGNPVTVVADADGLDVATMRALAREFHQSETVFVLRPTRPEAARRLVAYTTAGVEVSGAGHHVLGAWAWLDSDGLAGDGPSTRLVQEVGRELLGVEIVRTPGSLPRVVLDQGPLAEPRPVTVGPDLATALGLEPGDLDATAHVLSTGVAHLHVAVRDRDAVDRVVVEPRPLATLLAGTAAEGCYVYTTAGPRPGTRESDDPAAAYARFFNPTVGIDEDPATGTAAGPLAAALVRWGAADAERPVAIAQGHAAGRPSRIRVDVEPSRVRVSGTAIVAGTGTIAVP